MKNLKKMTYTELANLLIANRKILVATKNLELKRQIILTNHEIMMEMDKRF